MQMHTTSANQKSMSDIRLAMNTGESYLSCERVFEPNCEEEKLSLTSL